MGAFKSMPKTDLFSSLNNPEVPHKLVVNLGALHKLVDNLEVLHKRVVNLGALHKLVANLEVPHKLVGNLGGPLKLVGNLEVHLKPEAAGTQQMESYLFGPRLVLFQCFFSAKIVAFEN